VTVGTIWDLGRWRRHWPWLAAGGLAVLVALWHIAGRHPAAPPPTVVVAQATGEGVVQEQLLFLRYCAFCHGADGRGDGLVAAGLRPAPADLTGLAVRRLSDERLSAGISDGVRGTAMPAFGGLLSAEQRAALVRYIRQTLQQDPAH